MDIFVKHTTKYVYECKHQNRVLVRYGTDSKDDSTGGGLTTFDPTR